MQYLEFVSLLFVKNHLEIKLNIIIMCTVTLKLLIFLILINHLSNISFAFNIKTCGQDLQFTIIQYL